MFKHFCCCLVILLIITISTSVSDTLLTERTGQIIDKNGRSYFNLFPGISRFESAELINDSKNGFVFKIHFTDSTGNNKIKIMEVSEEIIKNLNLAIDNYEYLNYKKNLGINWKILVGKFIYPSGRLNPKSKPVTMLLANGETINANLLYSDSMHFIVSNLDLPYDWKKHRNAVRIIRYSEIISLSEPYNSLVNRNINLFKLNLSYFQGISLFNAQEDNISLPPPPELERVLAESLANKPSPDSENQESLDDIFDKDSDFLHVYVNYSPKTYFSMLNDITIKRCYTYWHDDGIFGGYYVEETYPIPSAQFNGLNQNTPTYELSLNISNKIQLGLSYSYYPRVEPVWRHSSTSSVGYSIIVFTSLNLSRRNFYDLSLWKRFDINVSLGFIYGIVKNQTYIYLKDEHTEQGIVLYGQNTFVMPKEFKNELIGVSTGIKFDYYLLKFLSLDLNLFFNILKSYKFTENNRLSPNLMIDMPQNIINYTGLGLKFGFGFHY